MMEFCTRFVIPKAYDWMSVFDNKTIVVTTMCAVESRLGAARIVVSDLPGPWIAQRAVSVTANPSSFKDDLKVAMRSFSGVGDDESADVRILVANAHFDSMTANGHRVLNDLQRAANVVVSGYEEYPLIGETAIHVVGRPPAVVKFASLLNESLLCDETAVLADGQLVVDQHPTERIRIATTDSAPTYPFRVPVRRVRRATSSPKLIKLFSRPTTVEHTSRLVIAGPPVRHVMARSRVLAIYKATIDACTWGRS